MEVRPGNSKVFHHANVIIDRSGSALRKEPKPGAGFAGMDLTVEMCIRDSTEGKQHVVWSKALRLSINKVSLSITKWLHLLRTGVDPVKLEMVSTCTESTCVGHVVFRGPHRKA